MLSEEQFNALAWRIMRLGYDGMTAARFAALIGDTPCVDEAGLTVVRDEQGQVLARLRIGDNSGPSTKANTWSALLLCHDALCLLV